jgi:hypothetical protein|tara:strand:+ start:1857 stop:2153 length:297 start_codon:yes stop_codon:yes gene_type:complete
MSRINSKEIIINKRRTFSSESIDSIESRSMSIGSIESITLVVEKEEIKSIPRKGILIKDNNNNKKRRVRDAELEYIEASPNISYFNQLIANNAWTSKK